MADALTVISTRISLRLKRAIAKEKARTGMSLTYMIEVACWQFLEDARTVESDRPRRVLWREATK